MAAQTGAKRGRPVGFRLSDEHKANMAVGREQARAVAKYLEALTAHQPKRGRKRSAETIEKRLAAISDRVPFATAVERLSLVAERERLENELATLTSGQDVSEFEAAFVAVAKEYSDRKGISYAAWREVGVPADVLTSAGITRGQAKTAA